MPSRERDTSMNSIVTRARHRGAFLALPVIAVALACSDLTNLEQEDPSKILARDAYVPRNAALLVNGAISDFECAFFRYVVGAGLLGDELVNAFANTNNYHYDRRTHPLTGTYAGGCGGAQLPGVYTSLSIARASSDTILARLEEWTDAEVPSTVNRTQLIGQAAAYAGYSLILLGEGMCSAAINVGPELTPVELLEAASLRFDRAIAAATTANDATTRDFALLGRARTLLNLAYLTVDSGAAPNPSLLARADSAARLIPPTFVVNALAKGDGLNRQQNIIFLHTGVAGPSPGSSNYSSVDPTFDSLKVDGVLDSIRIRVVRPVAADGTPLRGSDGVTPLRQQTKYANAGSPAPIARATEARLIEAEVAAETGDVSRAVGIINALRTAARMPQYNETNRDSVLKQVREERRRELFLESHRLGDMRRLYLPLIPATGTAFPRGGTYSDQRCFPLPAVERNNNPNIPDV